MFLFLSDETNTSQSTQAQFLIFGALVVPLAAAGPLAEHVLQIRRDAGYPPGSEFKFDSRSRPNSVSIEKCAAAKNAVLEMAAEPGVRFLACVVHHQIAAKLSAKDRPLFALKTLLCEFDLFLKRENTTGFCAVDRFEIAHSVLATILTGGVDPSGQLGRFQRELSSIWLYSVTSIGCSHLCSLCDIVLGAFRYCVNATDETGVARTIYPKVRRLFLHQPNAPAVIENWGLFLRPKTVQVKVYADAYENLRRHLAALESPTP